MDKLSDLERTRIEMNAVVPLLRLFQEEFGSDEVVEILKNQITDLELKAKATKVPTADLTMYLDYFHNYMKENELEYELLKCEKNSLEFNITKCPFHELMVELEATDIAPYLICNLDFATAYGLGGELTRTKTRMENADCCDFKYKPRNDI